MVYTGRKHQLQVAHKLRKSTGKYKSEHYLSFKSYLAERCFQSNSGNEYTSIGPIINSEVQYGYVLGDLLYDIEIADIPIILLTHTVQMVQ